MADEEKTQPPRPEAERPAAHLARLAGEAGLPPGVVAELAYEMARTPEGAPALSAAAAPPAVVAGRYQDLEPIGAGGMGRVFRARDVRLDRRVALKLLRAGAGLEIDRFMHEARSQARVDHPHVCKVYEAGEDDAGPYIAMQLIEGRTLLEATARLDPAARVRLFVGVVRGVQAAHRQGLVHRDLKPSNVLVEDTDGRPHAYVTDFGIAVEGGTQLTSEALVGTPAYMSPEQARGQRFLDERSDVYSLGATLYALLSGAPPFSGTLVEIVPAILARDPPGLRRRAPATPRDLEIVAMKCLEKDPARRYATAGDLGDDLERFLAGRPIVARAPSRTYRLGRLVRRHRALAVALAVAALALVAAGGQALRARWLAAERAAVAERFGEQVSEIDRIMGRAHTLPLHDLGRERELVRARMAAVAADMRRLGDEAAGPGEYSLGRGWLALGDPAAARGHLEAAWRRGYREPGVAMALGLTLGRLYQQELGEAARIPDDAVRAQRKRTLARSLRDPALGFLRSARGLAGESPAFVAAEIALIDERNADAIALAAAAAAAAPWLYEARGLAARAHVAIAGDLLAQNQHVAALAELERAGLDFGAALEAGRSDPALLEGECDRRAQLLHTGLAPGVPLAARGAQALEACERALAADRGSVRALLGEAYVHRALAGGQLQQLRDPDGEIAATIDAATRALALAPGKLDGWSLRGSALGMAGQRKLDLGLDPTSELLRAAADLAVARELRPWDVRMSMIVASSYVRLASYQLRKGRDPTSALDRATGGLTPAAFDRRAGVVVPTMTSVGVACATRAEHRFRAGRDWRAASDCAASAYLRVCALACTAERAMNLGTSLIDRARYEAASGADPRPALAAADAAFERAIALGQNAPAACAGAGRHHVMAARLASDAGDDPMPRLAEARRLYDRALAAGLDRRFIVPDLLSMHELAARHLLETGADPSPELAGVAELTAELASAPDPGGGWLFAAGAELVRARWQLARGASPDDALGRAERALERAGTPDAGLMPTLELRRAELLELRAGR